MLPIRSFVLNLMLATSAWAAAPPLRDPLPQGAIARLGYARLVAADGDELRVTPDGKYLRSAWTQYGAESSLPVRWFRLFDGVDSPPIRVPAGHQLRHVFADGSFLVRRKDQLLHFASVGAVKPRAVFDAEKDDRLHFDRAGRHCARLDVGDKETVLWVASLRNDPRWRRLATVNERIYAMLLSDAGDHVVWCHDGSAHVHDLKSGRTVVVPDAGEKDESVYTPAISPDGKVLVRLSDRGVRLLDLATGKVIRSADIPGMAPHQSARFTTDGKLLVVMTRAGSELHVIPLDPRLAAWKVPLTRVHRFALFPDGRRVAVYDEYHVIRLHDLRTGERLDDHSRYRGIPRVWMIGKDTAAAWTGCERLVTWDVRTGRVLAEVRMPAFIPERFSGDGKHVAGWTRGGCLVAETRTGKVLARFDANRERTRIDLDPSGEGLLMAEHDGDEAINVKRLTFSGVRRDSKLRLPSSWEPSIGFSPDGRFLFHAGGTFGALYEVATGKSRWETSWALPERLSESSPPTFAIRFDRRGRTVLVARRRERDATLFDVTTGRRLAIIPTGGSTLSGSGRWLADHTRHEITLWDLHARHPIEPAFAWTLPGPEITGIELDEDGARLLTTHHDGTSLVWDLAALRSRAAAERDEWELLGGDDPRPAMRSLIEQPARGVRLLAGKLTPLPHVPGEKIAGWIERLGSDSFAERTEAEARLKECLAQAEGPMWRAEPSATPEARLRLRRLLHRLDERETDPRWLRQVRGIEVLERIATPEAVGLLQKLARGAAGAALTREAERALGRMR